MPSQGYLNPISVITSGGTVSWIQPGSARITDQAYSTWTSDGSEVLSAFLVATNFGFTLPGASVEGIQVQIVRKAGSLFSSTVEDNVVQLIKTGSAQGENKALIGASWSTSDTTVTYGGSSDLWGLSFNVNDVNASDFGVRLQTEVNTPSDANPANVDSFAITVYFATSGLNKKNITIPSGSKMSMVNTNRMNINAA